MKRKPAEPEVRTLLHQTRLVPESTQSDQSTGYTTVLFSEKLHSTACFFQSIKLTLSLARPSCHSRAN